MSSNTAIIGILLLLIFIVPIFYAIIKSKAKKRKIEGLTQKLINQHEISPTDTFNDLGKQQFILDAHSKKLLHFEIEKSGESKGNIWAINDLKSIKPDYSYYTSPSNQQIIDKMHLEIVEKDGDKTSILIYDENTNNIHEVDQFRATLEKLVSKVNTLQR